MSSEHLKCSLPLPTGHIVGKMHMSSKCTQHVITGFQAPLPPVLGRCTQNPRKCQMLAQPERLPAESERTQANTSGYERSSPSIVRSWLQHMVMGFGRSPTGPKRYLTDMGGVSPDPRRTPTGSNGVRPDSSGVARAELGRTVIGLGCLLHIPSAGLLASPSCKTAAFGRCFAHRISFCSPSP